MTHDEVKAIIEKKFAGKMTPLDTGRWAPLYEVKLADLHEVCLALRDDPDLTFDYLCNCNGFDSGEHFEAQYQIASVYKHGRLDFKVMLDRQKPTLPTLIDVWPAINWYEREMWELYGFDIEGHPNLTRFLLPDDWDQGHPMRKDWDAPDFVRMPEFKS